MIVNNGLVIDAHACAFARRFDKQGEVQSVLFYILHRCKLYVLCGGQAGLSPNLFGLGLI